MKKRVFGLIVTALLLSACGSTGTSSSSSAKSETTTSSEGTSSGETTTSSESSSNTTSSSSASSSEASSSSSAAPQPMSHDDVNTTIYPLNKNNKTLANGRVEIKPTFIGDPESFMASFTGSDIRIDTIGGKQYITALKAGTTTKVTLNSSGGKTCSFNVIVPASSYSATSTRDGSWNSRSQVTSVEEGWFTSTSVGQINEMGSDFMNGMDISSCKALYQNGTNFYNKNGVKQSLFYILKDAGVNWIRLKLWVDPYTTGGISYGGGESDLNNTLWMAYEAKKAGLNLLLDLHYSDYWTHPAQQILPKAWAGATTVNELKAFIKNYTKDTLNTFKNAGCLPEMVQLGNEISSGSFLNNPGSNSESLNSNFLPGYLYNAAGYKATGSYQLTANYSQRATSGSSNMNQYLSAGIEGVKEVSSSVKTVVHWAKGSTINSTVINNFFNSITADYDYAALSLYPYYCFDSISTAQSILNGLSISKPWFIAETSYPFSGYSWVYEESSTKPTSNVTGGLINNWTTSSEAGCIGIRDSYPFNGQGQANLIHDLTAATVAAGGKGIFYWEAAWVPNAYVGWAGRGSSCSWSNQGFFSYDGKAIANLDLFAQMSPHF